MAPSFPPDSGCSPPRRGAPLRGPHRQGKPAEVTEAWALSKLWRSVLGLACGCFAPRSFLCFDGSGSPRQPLDCFEVEVRQVLGGGVGSSPLHPSWLL